jgi:hypothetical protein
MYDRIWPENNRLSPDRAHDITAPARIKLNPYQRKGYFAVPAQRANATQKRPYAFLSNLRAM